VLRPDPPASLRRLAPTDARFEPGSSAARVSQSSPTVPVSLTPALTDRSLRLTVAAGVDGGPGAALGLALLTRGVIAGRSAP